MKNFVAGLKKENVGKAVVFSTSWISKHAIKVLKDALNRKGIPVEDETFYFRGKPGEKQLHEAVRKVRQICGQ